MTRRAAALLALLLAAPPATAEKDRAFAVSAGGRRVRVVVPKVFDPLLPGSVYPNRREPRPPRLAPAVVVDRALAGRAEAPLLDRGFLVAEIDAPDRAAVGAIREVLRTRFGGGEIAVLALRARDLLGDPEIRAAALFDPPDLRAGADSPACGRIAAFRRSTTGDVDAGPADRCVAERWFRTGDAFPEEAFRDAAEWLASAAVPANPRR